MQPLGLLWWTSPFVCRRTLLFRSVLSSLFFVFLSLKDGSICPVSLAHGFFFFLLLPRFGAVPAVAIIFSTPFPFLRSWQPFVPRLFDTVSNTSGAPFINQPIGEGELSSFLVTGSLCIVVPIEVVDWYTNAWEYILFVLCFRFDCCCVADKPFFLFFCSCSSYIHWSRSEQLLWWPHSRVFWWTDNTYQFNQNQIDSAIYLLFCSFCCTRIRHTTRNTAQKAVACQDSRVCCMIPNRSLCMWVWVSTSILYSHVVLLSIRQSRWIRTHFFLNFVLFLCFLNPRISVCVCGGMYGSVLLFCWLSLWTVGEHTLCAISTTTLLVVSTSGAAMAVIIAVRF